MTNRNIKNLPLLEAFDAIMTRGSVVDAAEAMNVTQSAVSKQLSQLREWFADELFVRTREGMQPTPHAWSLRERIQLILAEANALTAGNVPPPKDFSGKFVLSGTDEILARLAPKLVDRLAHEAPKLRLVTLPLVRDYLVRQLEAGQVNLVVAVNWNAPELLKQMRLGSDPFVCVMHRDHPLAETNLTLKRYADATHVLVAPLGNERGVIDIELERKGLQRHVCASVSAFHMVDEDLLGKSRIATLPSKVAEEVLRNGPFVVKKIPMTLPTTDYYALWHSRFSAEPRLRWMLTAISDMFDPGPPSGDALPRREFPR
ncbi:MAG: LysR family transcriptional regulator [Xanthomonadales bacterium]|nr:LysR family transcriptional regulator [Xanthomonadales bacterium]